MTEFLVAMLIFFPLISVGIAKNVEASELRKSGSSEPLEANPLVELSYHELKKIYKSSNSAKHCLKYGRHLQGTKKLDATSMLKFFKNSCMNVVIEPNIGWKQLVDPRVIHKYDNPERRVSDLDKEFKSSNNTLKGGAWETCMGDGRSGSGRSSVLQFKEALLYRK